jgi:hypothetical protein
MRSSQELAALREQAVRLRREGKSRREIKKILGFIGNSTLNQLLRDEPLPPERTGPGYAESRVRAAEGVRRYWAAERPAREAARAAKPHRRADRVTFANSDPELISFFLLFLDVADISRSDLAFQLQIHETADVASAEQFWLALTGARPEQFRKTSLKRHNPETTRKNTSDGYYGCLRVDVKRSCGLYRKIEGWASAVTRVAAAPD